MKKWKHLKCILTDEWIKVWSIYKMEYYLAMNSNISTREMSRDERAGRPWACRSSWAHQNYNYLQNNHWRKRPEPTWIYCTTKGIPKEPQGCSGFLKTFYIWLTSPPFPWNAQGWELEPGSHFCWSTESLKVLWLTGLFQEKCTLLGSWSLPFTSPSSCSNGRAWPLNTPARSVVGPLPKHQSFP